MIQFSDDAAILCLMSIMVDITTYKQEIKKKLSSGVMDTSSLSMSIQHKKLFLTLSPLETTHQW